MSWNLPTEIEPLEGEEVRVALKDGGICAGYWLSIPPSGRKVWLEPGGSAIEVQAWQRAGNRVAVPPGIIPPADIERRLLAFCRTVRVLPGDDLRARSTWPAQFVDIARRIDEELRWTEREEEPRRLIPSARDLDDVLIAGDWFARLRDPVSAGKRRRAWTFSLEQKVIWWASFEPRPSWRMMSQWHGGLSHVTMRNRYNRALGKAYDIANAAHSSV